MSVADLLGRKRKLDKQLREAGMFQIYLLLSTAAQSEAGLERLHNSLPPNCRLMRGDFITFRTFWKEIFWGNEVPGRPTIADAGFYRICEASSNWQMPERQNLTRYYVEIIDGHGDRASVMTQLDEAHTRNNRIVFSNVYRQGHGYRHFTTMCFGHRFEVGCQLIPSQGKLVVELVIWGDNLNEELTYKIITNEALASSFLQHNGLNWGRVCGSRGSQLNFIFILEDVDDLLAMTTEANYPQGETTVRHDPVLTGGYEFCNELERRLKQLGLPIGQIGRVIGDAEWDERDYPEGVIPFIDRFDDIQFADYRS